MGDEARAQGACSTWLDVGVTRTHRFGGTWLRGAASSDGIVASRPDVPQTKVAHMPTTPFIKYSSDVETVDPGFDENLQTVIAKTEAYITQSVTTEGTGRAVRDAHAKGYGLVRGEVEILDQLPTEYAQGIYYTPGKHDALIRFSNGSPHAGADARLGGATGLALKIFGINPARGRVRHPHFRLRQHQCAGFLL